MILLLIIIMLEYIRGIALDIRAQKVALQEYQRKEILMLEQMKILQTEMDIRAHEVAIQEYQRREIIMLEEMKILQTEVDGYQEKEVEWKTLKEDLEDLRAKHVESLRENLRLGTAYDELKFTKEKRVAKPRRIKKKGGERGQKAPDTCLKVEGPDCQGMPERACSNQPNWGSKTHLGKKVGDLLPMDSPVSGGLVPHSCI